MFENASEAKAEFHSECDFYVNKIKTCKQADIHRKQQQQKGNSIIATEKSVSERRRSNSVAL